MDDPRRESAATYDLAPHHPNDVPFYLSQIESPKCRILELGCGTGRVSLALAPHCASVRGLDHSASMVAVLREKARAGGLDSSQVQANVADITNFHLGQPFNLIIAPFRVLQNLETDAQLDGLFGCVSRHLAPRGRCILNAFNPNRSPERMRHEWVSEEEELAWEVETPRGLLRRFDRRAAIQFDPLVLYPELIERLYADDALVSETVLRVPMRCFYPDELLELVERYGYDVVGRWGGYEGEEYGLGPELVVAFTNAA